MKHIHRKRRQAGVGIVTAIFLLVVLAGLGVAMVGIYTSQQASANLDLLGARAYQAARAGLEWGIFRRRRVAGGAGCAPVTRIDLPAGTSLAGFTVFVRCTAQGTGELTRHVIEADACNLPDAASNSCPAVNDAGSVRRSLEAEL